jgi:hypothetical protein
VLVHQYLIRQEREEIQALAEAMALLAEQRLGTQGQQLRGAEVADKQPQPHHLPEESLELGRHLMAARGARERLGPRLVLGMAVAVAAEREALTVTAETAVTVLVQQPQV